MYIQRKKHSGLNMYEVIKNYCENEKTNGLFLMDLPTGFGKTHNVIQYIFDAVCDEKNKDKKFFFVTNLKKITPHKLRSTYGTALYKETGDIYLVADVLGHKDVNTTKKHYAAIEDERRRKARNAVKLRKD